jgi:gamma-glutamylcyclotransferase (GGCT)/AIG2-like uncharacterized protein YtfP
MRNLFAYGTLQLPEVMQAVTSRSFPAMPARLDGYSRHCLRGKSYPGIRPAAGASVAGLLFTGVDAQSWQRLDEFEDHFYRRETLQVIASDGIGWPAETYIIPVAFYGLLLPEEWSLAEFQHHRLSAFLHRHA